ncbi:MAG: cation-translocating P-type ATPase [Prevotella sp.]|nr:cation-translocating P-type ATPase [Prevotella sp.]
MDNTSNYHDPTASGLNSAQVEESRRLHGLNMLTPPERTPMWRLYIEKYNDPIIKILLVAAVVSLVLAFIEGEFAESIGIFLAVFLATTVGFYFERDAARRFNVLTAMNEEQPVKVVREGRVMEIPRRDVVVGDIVVLETGDEIPADGQLIEAVGIETDESALTGEPMARKRVVGEDGERDGEATYPEDVMLRSTMIMGGTGRMRVTAVGDATEIGRVAGKSTEMTGVKTPLSGQLDRLAAMISKVGTGVAVTAFVVFLGHDILTRPLWHTDNYIEMASTVLRYFMMAVTLIVMAVPEGLPMAVTLALALNMRRMLKTNNLVRRLHACETMGAVTVICTDKTGTLTQNRMTVREIEYSRPSDLLPSQALHASLPHYGEPEDLLLTHFALNTTAELDGDSGIGNPTEVALLRHLVIRGIDYTLVRSAAGIVERVPFSTERKYMATLCDTAEGRILFVKGAPEIVMACCDMPDTVRRQMESVLAGWQSQAMRTLAFACKAADTADVAHLTLQAVAAISDPLRPEVPAAVSSCRAAGIDVKIVTGDTTATAMEIARQIGVVVTDIQESGEETLNKDKAALHEAEESSSSSTEASITGPEFAALSDEEAFRRIGGLKVMSRARPADKQRLVNLLQQRGEVVAVTGDGTNDAPALNHAHVGLSLGSGTSVAKNASDMTLMDDSFNSIVRAVRWGRSLYRNIQRFIFFQLVVNVTALLLVLGGSFIGTELPLTITQMLWVNLIMDTFAAMALASLPPEDDVMNEAPRSRDAFIITWNSGKAIAAIGLLFFAVMLAMLYYFEHVAGISAEELTIFFTVFVMLQWWNLLNAKTLGTTKSAIAGLTADRGLVLVLAVILAGQWLIVTFGGEMFRTVPLSASTWGLIVLATSPVLIVGELLRLVRRGMENTSKENTEE